jgi:hypothetical protein
MFSSDRGLKQKIRRKPAEAPARGSMLVGSIEHAGPRPVPLIVAVFDAATKQWCRGFEANSRQAF